MSDLVIPEDLRSAYREARASRSAQCYMGAEVADLIERIAQAEAKAAVLETENGKLREVVTLCEHKIEQHLQGQYPDGAALRAALAFARAQQPSPQDKPPDSLKQELLKEIMADPGNQLFGIPLSEVQRIIAAHKAAQSKEQG